MVKKTERITRQLAIDLLSAMPPAFGVNEFCRDTGIDSAQAGTYLARWEADGLIARFGVSAFFNLVKDPEARKTQPGLALEILLQRPFVMVGGAALYHAGWTGQVQRRIEIAVPVTGQNTAMPVVPGGFVLVPRFPKHVQTLLAHQAENASGWDSIPVASPAYALADMFAAMPAGPKAERVSIVPPDEIDPDLLDGDERGAVLQALQDLGASPALRERVMQDYGQALSGRSGPSP